MGSERKLFVFFASPADQRRVHPAYMPRIPETQVFPVRDYSTGRYRVNKEASCLLDSSTD